MRTKAEDHYHGIDDSEVSGETDYQAHTTGRTRPVCYLMFLSVRCSVPRESGNGFRESLDLRGSGCPEAGHMERKREEPRQQHLGDRAVFVLHGRDGFRRISQRTVCQTCDLFPCSIFVEQWPSIRQAMARSLSTFATMPSFILLIFGVSSPSYFLFIV